MHNTPPPPPQTLRLLYIYSDEDVQEKVAHICMIMERLDAIRTTSPKLLLSRLPSKARDANIIMQTPPLNKLASIPFQWEEAPGKPRTTTTTTRSPCNKLIPVARCLNLPPRLLNNVKVSNVASPESTSTTVVLDGPQSKGSLLRSLVEEIVREEEDEKTQEEKSKRGKFIGTSSRRWGSFKGISMRSQKISRVRRRSSFLGLSHHATCTLLAGIYGSLKQVVPWRWRQQ